MRRGGRGNRSSNDSEERRQRKRRKRAENHGGGITHRTVVCPGCRGNIPWLDGRQDPPVECGGCGHRFLCESCGADIRTVDRVHLEGGVCPRCDEPVDGETVEPGDEEFTW